VDAGQNLLSLDPQLPIRAQLLRGGQESWPA
jgi:hypothetical protein